MKNTSLPLAGCAVTLLSQPLCASEADTTEVNPYMGAPVALGKAPNGAIANKKLLDGINEVSWSKPTIEQPAEGIWVFGGYGLAPMSVIDTDEGLILFDTGDTWAKIYLSEATIDGLIESGDLEVAAGDAADATRVLDAFDRYDPRKAVVVPPTSLVQNHM